MQTLLWIYLAGGLLLAFISLPLIAGKIPPNYLYGFRIPATLEDPELWYPVNRFAARRLFVTGLVLILAAIVLNFWPGITLDAYAWAILGILIVMFSIVIVQSVSYLRKLKSNRAGNDHTSPVEDR